MNDGKKTFTQLKDGIWEGVEIGRTCQPGPETAMAVQRSQAMQDAMSYLDPVPEIAVTAQRATEPTRGGHFAPGWKLGMWE